MWLVWLQLLHYFKSDDGYFQTLNKAVLEKSKFCGSKIENTHLKGKHDPTF